LNINPKFVALLLLLGVVLVFISPAVNLSPTALRASRAAQRLALTLVAAAFLVDAFLVASISRGGRSTEMNVRRAHGDLLEQICARLC
jgi:hypothetical protein